MDVIQFEKIIIKLLFMNLKVRDKVTPYLDPSMFNNKNNVTITKNILEFNEKYERFPTIPEMKIGLEDEQAFNQLLEIMDIATDEYNDDFVLDSIEDFLKMKLVNNVNINIATGLHNNDMESIKESPDKLREALSFTFDTKIGLDFFSEEERIYNFLHSEETYIPTPITDLNKLIGGGFHEKSLTLFMAETNLGKSLIMASLAADAILINKNVLYVTCEMSEDKISERIIANTFDVNINELIALSKNAFHQKFESIKNKIGNRLIIKEYPPAAINTNHIRNLMKELEVQKKFKPDIVFVDYLGIMLPTHRNKVDNTYIEVKRISEEVRALAVEYSIPFVSGVQTNRGGFGDPELDLTDISDSIGTAATADVIIGVTQSDQMRKEGKFSWIILKNRYGQNKRKIAVNVDYLKMRVYNDDESEIKNTASSITTAEEKDQNKKSAISDVQGAIKKDINDKFNKTIEFD